MRNLSMFVLALLLCAAPDVAQAKWILQVVNLNNQEVRLYEPTNNKWNLPLFLGTHMGPGWGCEVSRVDPRQPKNRTLGCYPKERASRYRTRVRATTTQGASMELEVNGPRSGRVTYEATLCWVDGRGGELRMRRPVCWDKRRAARLDAKIRTKKRADRKRSGQK